MRRVISYLVSNGEASRTNGKSSKGPPQGARDSFSCYLSEMNVETTRRGRVYPLSLED